MTCPRKGEPGHRELAQQLIEAARQGLHYQWLNLMEELGCRAPVSNAQVATKLVRLAGGTGKALASRGDDSGLLPFLRQISEGRQEGGAWLRGRHLLKMVGPALLSREHNGLCPGGGRCLVIIGDLT